jgi:alkylated DNA repair dioxygenase AlkB
MSHVTKLKLISSIGRRLFSSQASFPPGLRLIENFLPASKEIILRNKSLELVQQISSAIKHSQMVKTKTYLSKQHNLETEEFYHKIRLTDENRKNLEAQHFAKYGDDGHSLTYFIGNSNIPHYVQTQLIPSLEKLQPPIHEPSLASKSPQWRFSFNIYRSVNSQRAGFPWHFDTASNGTATAIYTLLSEAHMELKQPSDSSAAYKIALPPNSLLILSGEARWKWQHRVLSENNDSGPLSGDEAPVKRLSLVLGCQ